MKGIKNLKQDGGLILFICKANVGRSQIAEGIYNNIHGGGAISLAGNQARKKKYKSKPLKSIVEFLRIRKCLDISFHKVKYLKDIPNEIIAKIDAIYFLYDPINDDSCDELCNKAGFSPYFFFKKLGLPMYIYSIPDPFDTGEEGYEKIYQNIFDLVTQIK